ncbi:beta-propeller fold lactonase family protein [Granulicella sp. dw_53]|uniref:beta-propeller fold lactonase family protein n=1 Tax=Granulicella sp. dw_53 TaxID=2719792 RepID=UPI001BD3A857
MVLFEMMLGRGKKAMAARAAKLQWRILLAASVVALTGCSNFFVPQNNSGGGSSGGGGGGTVSSGNLVYVGSANATTQTVSGFSVGTGTLTAVSSAPFSIGVVPLAEVVTISNTFLYVAGPGAIYAYVIGSDGSLSTPSTGASQAIVFATALDVSPDGNWLFALDGTFQQLDIYQINKTTGALSQSSAVPYSISTTSVQPKSVKISPNGGLIFAALGTAGDAVFTFNTSTGVATPGTPLAPISTQTSDNALAVDNTSTHLYIARTGQGAGLAAYTIGSGGSLTAVNGSPFAAGAQPLAVALDSTGAFAYVANGTDATISGYSLTNGVATPLSGSPYASGQSVVSLALAGGGKYLLAAASQGSPDLTMYSFDATVAGKLDQVATAATGTDPAGALVVVASH